MCQIKNTRERERERERDQTHTYWYKPSAPRVDYSLVIVVAVGMMKMVTGDDSPLRQGAGMGSRLDLMDTEALQRWNFLSRVAPKGFGIFGNL